MELNGLKLFVVVVEAAHRTGVPSPTLSRGVRKLEDELGS